MAHWDVIMCASLFIQYRATTNFNEHLKAKFLVEETLSQTYFTELLFVAMILDNALILVL